MRGVSLIKSLALSICIAASTLSFAQDAKTTPGTPKDKEVVLVDWSSDDGMQRFERSKAKVDFFKLANNFETQHNRIYCGPTSAAIVLNTFKLRQKDASLPSDKTSITEEYLTTLPKDFNPFLDKYTQDNVLLKSPKTKAEVLGKPVMIDNKEAQDFGYQLRQFDALLKAHGLNVKMQVVDDKSDDKLIKKDLVNNLKTKDDYVLVNYKRAALGQNGGGHISPLGAYDEKSDSFLIMDVNPNTAGWVWVKSADLINAMRTLDTIENRGYVLVSEGVKTVN